MADVTGPISTLPGSAHGVPEGTMCDEHHERPAYRRVQGETDSFGSEMIDMCIECYTSYQEACKTADPSGCCDWCKTHKPRLFKRRDFDEGMSGPVYDVCSDCIARQIAAVQEELEDDYDDEPYSWG